MTVKIYWQDVWPKKINSLERLEIMWDKLDLYAKKVLRPDTKVILGHPEVSGIFLEYAYLELLNNRSVIEGVIGAAKNGYDGAMIGCYSDPGLHEARSMVEIPVTAVGEASMIMGLLMGRKLAVVTIGAGYVPIIEKNIRLLGLESRFIGKQPVRHFDMRTNDLLDAFEGRCDKLISMFERVARSCVEEGADCILAGCGWMGPCFTLCEYTEVAGTGVAVLDGTSAALKLAEAMGDLSKKGLWKKSSNPTNPYSALPSKISVKIRKQFGLFD